MIFITHIHGDHQLGILKILQERDNLMSNPDNRAFGKIYAVIPTPLLGCIEIFIKDSIVNQDMIILVPSIDLNPEKCFYYQKQNASNTIEAIYGIPDKAVCDPLSVEEVQKRIQEFTPPSEESKEMLQVLRDECGIDHLLAVEVDHCPQSYGCLIESKAHGKIVYSGDTLPCQNLINYAQNCRVLIHEATFQEGMEVDALMKKHTTSSQAMEVAKLCNAWRLVLTHFSPRYQKVCELTEKEMG